jgi:hypothetical protein
MWTAGGTEIRNGKQPPTVAPLSNCQEFPALFNTSIIIEHNQ